MSSANKEDSTGNKGKCHETNIIISIKDFPQLCRTCLSKGAEVSVFDTVTGSSGLKELLKTYAFISISDDDALPLKVCRNCVNEFKKMEMFTQKCQDSQKILHSILEEDTLNKEDKQRGQDVASIVKVELLDPNSVYQAQEFSDDDLYNSDVGENGDDDKSEEDPDYKPNATVQKAQKQNESGDSQTTINDDSTTAENEYNTEDDKEIIKIEKSDVDKKDAKMKECTECKKKIKTTKYKQHMRTHTKEKPFACEFEACDQRFSQRANMKRHMLQHTGEKPHVCEICGKGFTQPGSLNTHRKIHEHDDLLKDGTDLYCCDVCKRTFKRINCYTEHLKKHDPNYDPSKKKNSKDGVVYDNVCDICKRSYKTKRLLRAHQLTHGEKTVLCSECGKKFYTKIALNSHLTVHTGERNYECNTCHKFFAHASGLEVHMLIHKGEKKHKCTLCSKAFTQLQHLKYHMSTHTGEKNHECTYCGKTFALKSNLTVHVRTHTGETPYRCMICLNGYTNSSALKRHLLKHNDTIQPSFYSCNICNKVFRDPSSVRRHRKKHALEQASGQQPQAENIIEIKPEENEQETNTEFDN